MTTVTNTTTLVKSQKIPSSPRSTKPIIFLVLGILTSAGLGIGLGYDYSLFTGLTVGCSLGAMVLGIFFITRAKARSSKDDVQKTGTQTASSPPNSVSPKDRALSSSQEPSSREITPCFSPMKSPLPELLSKGFSYRNRNYITFSLHYSHRRSRVVDVDVIHMNRSDLLVRDVLQLYLDKYTTNYPQEKKLRSIENCAIFCFHCKLPHDFPISRLPFYWLDVVFCDQDQSSLLRRYGLQDIQDDLDDDKCMPKDVTLKATFDGSEWEFTVGNRGRTISEIAQIWFKLHQHEYLHQFKFKEDVTCLNPAKLENIFLNGDCIFDYSVLLNHYFSQDPNGVVIQKELVFTLPNCIKRL